jgi:hypothetical protein
VALVASAKIKGIYPIEAPEPCHLCEIEIRGMKEFEPIDFGEITQAVDGQDQSYWQVAYDERHVENSNEGSTYTFFFHYLDLNAPLLSPFGPLALPSPTALPDRLQLITYESP